MVITNICENMFKLQHVSDCLEKIIDSETRGKLLKLTTPLGQQLLIPNVGEESALSSFVL